MTVAVDMRLLLKEKFENFDFFHKYLKFMSQYLRFYLRYLKYLFGYELQMLRRLHMYAICGHRSRIYFLVNKRTVKMV